MLKSQLKLTQQVINLTKSVRSLSVTSELDRQDPDSDRPEILDSFKFSLILLKFFSVFLEPFNHSFIFELTLDFVPNLASIGIYLAVFPKGSLCCSLTTLYLEIPSTNIFNPDLINRNFRAQSTHSESVKGI